MAEDEPRSSKCWRRQVRNYGPITVPKLRIENDAGKINSASHDLRYRACCGTEQDHQVLRTGLVNYLAEYAQVCRNRDHEDVPDSSSDSLCHAFLAGMTGWMTFCALQVCGMVAQPGEDFVGMPVRREDRIPDMLDPSVPDDQRQAAKQRLARSLEHG